MKFFEITSTDKNTLARTGILRTDHGDVKTPIFMPVGTAAAIKSLDSADIEALDAEIILANTYHLHLRPGADRIEKLGGLHKFMDWNRAILTDSGGFQVWSLGQKSRPEASDDLDPKTDHGLSQIDDEGVTFRSHIDGSTHRFNPERAIEIQHQLGADIIMAFDQCTSDFSNEAEARLAMERTHRWAQQSLNAHLAGTRAPNHKQFLFGIIQGSIYKNLRQESAKFITSLPFDGIAIGGETTGFNMKKTREVLEWIEPILPKNKPLYTMGVGASPEDFFTVIEQGIDMFDCVAPTRLARNGSLYCRAAGAKNKFRIDIGNLQYAEDTTPVDNECSCLTCSRYSRAYLRHLFISKELTYYRLATVHNLAFMLNLIKKIRTAIRGGKFLEFKNEWLSRAS
ncbi:tRNA guanosine(34) transglycosylase Tgt [Candidatus Uhrbacteria bacterium]|nr:tRNA guanosine(34) transglycosylase Tgt [Candidatus Uhrbacteria bacterium]